ncbi:MAG TPA: VCBS repeat-containing protein, partial [Armatimonadota bacterium]
PAGGPWTRHLIARTGATQFHDEMVGDITNDGRQSLLFWNEGSGGLYWCPLPEDPTVSPWPGLMAIATGVREGTQPEEGLALADIDGDGRTEIVAGTYWYRYLGHGNEWERHKYCGNYITTVLAVGDVDGDGAPEIVVSEGDACIYGRPWGGRLAWFKPTADPKKPWEEHLIAEGLLDPHSLQLADLCGEGRLDVVVGEIGVADAYAEKPPKLLLFQNLGGGRFERHLIDEGTGTHHARLADFRGAGVLDIASRPLHGPDRGRIFVWYNDRGGSLGR